MPKKYIPLFPYCDRKDRKFFGVSCTINKNTSSDSDNPQADPAGEEENLNNSSDNNKEKGDEE